MDFRKGGISALQSVIVDNNLITQLEELIYENNKSCNDYKRVIYQTVGDVIGEINFDTILNNINSKKTGFNHTVYDSISDKIKEQNEFIKNPFINIEKGVIKCKCKSERVFSYAKQTRSGDESTTVFCECVECGSKWQLN